MRYLPALFATLALLGASNASAASAEATGDETSVTDDARQGAAAAPPIEIKTREVPYEHDGDALRGYLAVPADASPNDQRPGILVVHEWWGLNAYAKRRARELASLGYVALACDVYGAGKVTTDADQARAYAMPFYQDRLRFRARLRAGLAQLMKRPEVDTQRLGAIGYCFGGTAVLELARSGAPVRGVVSFHGGLGNPRPEDDQQIKAEVLICNGYDDELVPHEDRQALKESLTKAGVKWTFIDFGGAVHSFTNPAADEVGMASVAYDARADERSWAYMRAFFEALLAKRTASTAADGER